MPDHGSRRHGVTGCAVGSTAGGGGWRTEPHAHHHAGYASAPAVFGQVVWIAVGILVVEVVGGVVAHSLALVSDAAHMLTDVLALIAAYLAAKLAERPPTPRRTYGFDRAGILTALGNATLLGLVVLGIAIEAVVRLRHPVPVAAGVMSGVAVLGLCGNLFIGLRLGAAGGVHGGLNVQGAWLHVMGDAAASAGVLLAAGVIAWTHWQWLDPVVSLGIALLIAWGALGIVRKTVNILMEGTPFGLDPRTVAEAIAEDPAIISCHHLHIWSLGDGRRAFSGHLVLYDISVSESQSVLERTSRMLHDRFAIEHSTLQVEAGPCPPDGCQSWDAAEKASTDRR